MVIGRISQGLAQSHVYSLAGIEKSGHGTLSQGRQRVTLSLCRGILGIGACGVI